MKQAKNGYHHNKFEGKYTDSRKTRNEVNGLRNRKNSLSAPNKKIIDGEIGKENGVVDVINKNFVNVGEYN